MNLDSKTLFAAMVMLAASSSSAHLNVGSGDAGHDAGRDAGRDASITDAGHDADVDAFVWLDSGVDAGPVIWTSDDCFRAEDEGATGDPCSFPGGMICGGVTEQPEVGWSYRQTTCDIDSRLTIVEVQCLPCDTPAPAPWDGADCATVLAEGASGQQCTGEWLCTGPVEAEDCCVEVAACGNRMGVLDGMHLSRSHVCSVPCEIDAVANRPSWTECPGPRAPDGPEPLNGNPCEGVWSCSTELSAFAYIPSWNPVPTWCDGTVMRIGSVLDCNPRGLLFPTICDAL